MVKHLCMTLPQEQLKKYKIALLSDSEVPIVPNIKILTSKPGFIRGGRESARLLLSQIQEEQGENRIVIAPEPPTYI